MQASRYKIQELIDTQGAVSTYQALDTLSNQPVLYYQYLAEPIDNAAQILSDNIPDILNMHYTSGMTHVVTVFPPKKQQLMQRVQESELEQFLLDTSQALEDASDAGVVHGDIRPERILFDGTKYLIEGYGIRWELLPSRYSSPEKKQSSAADVYSWAKTVGAFVPFSIPTTIADILGRCLAKDPKDRPLAEDIVDELSTFFLEVSEDSKHPTLLNLKQTIADGQPDLLDNLFAQGKSEILTHTGERYINSEHIEASVMVDGSDDSGKLSTADLASNDFQSVSELSDSRADVSVLNTESLPEVSSSARITDAKVTNQNVSNQAVADQLGANLLANNNSLLGKSIGTSKRTVQEKAVTTSDNPELTTPDLDTIDKSLAIIADADTAAHGETPFLVEDDFSDLATKFEQVEQVEQVEPVEALQTSELDIPEANIPNAEVQDADIPDLEVTNMELADAKVDVPATSFTDVVIADNYATQERMIDVADAEIIGLDSIEHKATFHDLTSTQVDTIELQTSQNALDNDSTTAPAIDKTAFDLTDVEDDVLGTLLEDLPQTQASQTIEQESVSSVEDDGLDLESQAIENIFAEKPTEQDTSNGFDVSDLDFSDTGFEQTAPKARSAMSQDALAESKSSAVKDKASDLSNDFDATAFDMTSFDSKATAYDTKVDSVADEITSQGLATETAQAEFSLEDATEFDAFVEETEGFEELDSEVTQETIEKRNPTDFPVDESAFDAFAQGKSFSDAKDDFESEEEAHLKALQDVLAESQNVQDTVQLDKVTDEIELTGVSRAPNETSNEASIEQTVDIDDSKSLDVNELMPNSTQLERAFAALSTTIHDASTFGTSENNETLDLTNVAESNVEAKSEKTVDSNQQDIGLDDLNNDTTDDNIDSDNKAEIENANLSTDEDSSLENLKLTDTDFPEVDTQSDISNESLQSTEDTQEVLMVFDDEEDLPNDLPDSNVNTTTETTDLPEHSVKTEKGSQEVQATETPSFGGFVDDMDEAAHLYTTQIDTQVDKQIDVTSDGPEAKQENESLKQQEQAKAVDLPIEMFGDLTDPTSIEEIDRLALEASEMQAASTSSKDKDVKQKDSVKQESAMLADAGFDTAGFDTSNPLVSDTAEDGLDAFLGDVLDNENNSLLVQTSFSDESFDGDDASKGTLFPMYEQETLFSKETMQLEPGAVPSTDVVGDTGIFSHTVFDGEDIPDLSSPSSSSQEVAQAALDSADIEIADDDDDLQMIDLTNFGSDSEVSEVAAETTINVESDEERARAERRARRQAKRQAAAEEQEIDVFKTAFGKIAMMEASVEGPTTAESLQDKMVKETVENLLTAATVEGSLLTAATVVDESKLTVFEAKHLSIAEKIAAKKAAQLGAENNNYHSDQPDSSQAVVAKTEFGRNSRKVGEGPDVFGDDDYDAIGKLPNQNETPKTSDISNSPTAASAGANPAVNPKLTYFEMPPASDEEEQEAQGKAKKSEAKKQRRGLFGKRNAKVKKAKQKSDQSSDIFDTNLNTNLGDIDDGFNTTEQELSSDGLKITAERQQEFNKALSTSPMRNAWRIIAASLVLIGAGVIVFLAMPGLRNAQETYVEQSTVRETEAILGLNSDHVVFTQVSPASLDDIISIIVLDSPEGSKYPPGHEIEIFSNAPLSLDAKGAWQLQAKYKNRILSNTVTFDLPVLGGEPLQFFFNLQ